MMNRSYAIHMLKLAMPIATELGLALLLVICNPDNVASQKILKKSRGKLEDVLKEPGTIVRMKEYWIEPS